MSELLFVRVHVDGAEVWVNARRILTVIPHAERGAILRMNAGPAVETDEDVDEVLELFRGPGDDTTPFLVDFLRGIDPDELEKVALSRAGGWGEQRSLTGVMLDVLAEWVGGGG